MEMEDWVAKDLYVKGESCYHSTQNAATNVLDWMMCRVGLER